MTRSPFPPKNCREDARRILYEKSLACKQVISVDHDSILFVDLMKRPRTAWLHTTPGRPVRVRMEEGFVAEPPPGWHGN